MQWIKCSERFPLEEEPVLLLIDKEVYVGYLAIKPAYKTGRKHIVHHEERKYFTTYEYENCCNGRDPRFEDVTHWMNLPQLPGE